MFDISHIHPMTVHFAIALAMTGFLADVVSFIFKNEQNFFKKAGYYLQILAMIAVVVAFCTGFFLTNEMEGEAGELQEKHELFAKITLITIIISTILRILFVYLNKDETKYKYIYLGLLFLAVLGVSYTGFLGGALVYNFMIGL